MQQRDSLIFLESDGRFLSKPYSKIGWKLPFYEFCLVTWLTSYSNWMLIVSCGRHMLGVLLATLVMIDTLRMKYGEGLRVMTTWLAVPK